MKSAENCKWMSFIWNKSLNVKIRTRNCQLPVRRRWSIQLELALLSVIHFYRKIKLNLRKKSRIRYTTNPSRWRRFDQILWTEQSKDQTPSPTANAKKMEMMCRESPNLLFSTVAINHQSPPQEKVRTWEIQVFTTVVETLWSEVNQWGQQ